MAASSPVPSNNSNDTTTTTTVAGTTTNGSVNATATTPRRSDPPKNLRGLNKPKCFTCGNVARSRCPYQSCKSCCAKAQNPCHVHDKKQTSSAPMFDQQSTDVSPSGASLRLSSLRQLSNNFAQFNAAQVPLRTRRPLTRKDAANINQWRFSKLKEHRDRTIEAENESFDRYMQNVSLLEETFFLNSSVEVLIPEEENDRKMISGMKANIRSTPGRNDNFRQRLQILINGSLGKLRKGEFSDDLDEGPTNVDDPDGQKERKKPKNAVNLQAERASAINDLFDKLNKARNEEDLRSCLEMKSQLFNHGEAVLSEKVPVAIQEPNCTIPKSWSMVEINQETLNHIDMHFSSLEGL